MSRPSTRSYRWLRYLALTAGLSLLASGCMFFEVAENHKAGSPSTRPYYCNAAGDGTPISGHGNGSHVAPIYEGITKGKLSWDDCLQLGRELDEASEAVSELMTRGEAEAADWDELANYVPGLGTHHVEEGTFGRNEDGIFEFPPFDPAEPNFLIYGGEGPDAPLVGLAYGAPGTDDPPEAFAGDNDWWHLHEKICIGPSQEVLAGAEEIPDEECDALGGRQVSLGAGIWLLHLWAIPHYQIQYDIFTSGHPCLGETGPLPSEDPCWELANRDPALGMPDDDHGGGDHDDHGH